MCTKKLYDIDAYETEFEATVLECQEVENVYRVILDQTLFFPEEGGQTADKGMVNGIEVLDVQINGDVVLHYMPYYMEPGSKVKGNIDWKHRFFNMQQHSAEHIFSGLAYKKYGYKNVGFHLSNQIVTMDFDGVFTNEQLNEMEWEVNEAIVANAKIKTSYPSQEELGQMDYRSKLDFTENVRIVEIEGYDACACCAPHVCRTGEIGMFKIQTAQNYKGGMRISFLCGFRALEECRSKAEIISELSGILTTNQKNLPEHVMKLKNQVSYLKAKVSTLQQEVLEQRLKEISEEQSDVLLFENGVETVVMRNVVNKLMETHKGICGIFDGSDVDGYQFILGSRSRDCREIAGVLREELKARGGGKAQMIQGSVDANRNEILRCLKVGKEV